MLDLFIIGWYALNMLNWNGLKMSEYPKLNKSITGDQFRINENGFFISYGAPLNEGEIHCTIKGFRKKDGHIFIQEQYEYNINDWEE